MFHDDQHGTAIVLLAGMLNAARVTGRKPANLKVVINGAGAAGTAIASLLRCVDFDPVVCTPVADVVVCDSKGAIYRGREGLSEEKQALLHYTNRENRVGTLHEVLADADVFVGVSKGNLLTAGDIQLMAPDPIVLAMANPTPEIMPNEAQLGAPQWSTPGAVISQIKLTTCWPSPASSEVHSTLAQPRSLPP